MIVPLALVLAAQIAASTASPVAPPLGSRSASAIPEFSCRLGPVSVPSLEDLMTRKAAVDDAWESLRDGWAAAQSRAFGEAREALTESGRSLARAWRGPVGWTAAEAELLGPPRAFKLKLRWGSLTFEFGPGLQASLGADQPALEQR